MTMDHPSPENPPGEKPRRTTAGILRIFGIAMPVVMLLAGAIHVAGRVEGVSSVGTAQIAELGVYLAAGVATGALLVGMAALLRILGELHASLVRLEQFRYEHRDASGSAADPDGLAQIVATVDHDSDTIDTPPPIDGTWQEMIRLLQDIRDNSLLSEDQRQEKRHRVSDEEIRRTQSLLRALTSRGDFVQAREIAEKTRRKYSNDERAAVLVDHVETARQQHEGNDVIATTKQVNDLINISAWQRAREVAGQLRERHPDLAEARHLLLRIEREHKLFQDEQRRRMYAEIQRYVTRRRWEEALAAARTFSERFPGCEESEALRLQIPTLEANSEIDVRQKLEAEIMDLTRHGRYIEAVELARKVIARYPESPQAEALRGQLGRLEALAHDPEAPPARVRLDD